MFYRYVFNIYLLVTANYFTFFNIFDGCLSVFALCRNIIFNSIDFNECFLLNLQSQRKNDL